MIVRRTPAGEAMPEIDGGREWSAMDLFDLRQQRQRAQSIEDTAKFRGRGIEDVRRKTEEVERALGWARIG